MKDIDKKIEELESQAKQSLGIEDEPPETEDAPPVEESEEPEVEESAEEPEVETEEEPEVETETCQECERLKAELETATKRVRDTQAHMHSATTEASKMRKEIGELKTENARLEGKLEALKSEPEEESQVETLYPEVAEELRKRDKKIESYEERMDRLEKERSDGDERRKADDDLKAKAFLLERHPDIAQVVPTSEFQDWVKNHPYRNYVVAVLDAPPTLDTVGEIDKILSDYKKPTATENLPNDDPVEKAKKIATPKPKNKARTPDIKPKEGKRYSLTQLKTMTPEQYDKVSSDVDKAFIEGRVDP